MRRIRIPLSLMALALAGAAGTPAAAAAARTDAQGPAAQPAALTVAAEIREQARGQVKSFYAGRNFSPLWAREGKIGPEAEALLDFLATADLDGLKPSSYKTDKLREMVDASRSGDPRLVARAELALSGAFARYARDQRRRLRVKMIYAEKALQPKKLKPAAILRAASLVQSFDDYVANMGWMSAHYVRQRKLLARAEKLGSSEEVIDRIRLNLERTRLLPGAWTHHIVVDAASARLWYYEQGKEQGPMKVVVGAAETETPMLAGTVRYAIVNPYWNVPVDFTRRKLAPKILAGRTLKSMHMEALSDWGPSPRMIDPSTIDWPSVASGAQQIRLRELPGPDNSMGRVKFMFPNAQGIYLHDTPDRKLFAESDRHFSNGCIRLENAAKLGRWLLGGSIPATKKPEQVVPLRVPVPVYLTYVTSTPTEAGVGFLKDVYARDGVPTRARLAAAR